MPNLEPLQTIVTTANSSSITFSNIPNYYTDLIIRYQYIASTGGQGLSIRFNGDTSSNYSSTMLGVYSGNPSSARELNQTRLWTGGWNVADSQTKPNIGEIHINNYANKGAYKTTISMHGKTTEATQIAGTWRSSEAISAITLTTESLSGAIFELYGMKLQTPKAFGGDYVYQSGGYWVHEFRNSGIFLTTQNLTLDYLVVAAGGGGGWAGGGGGGAGGLRSTVTGTGGGGSLESQLSLSTGNYIVTVGAGGAGGYSAAHALSGTDSTLGSITSTGGGGAGGDSNPSAYNGGSGGGADRNSGTAGAGTSGQGYAGGVGFPSSGGSAGWGIGGGGGGASEAGNTDGRGDGGDGISTSITGSSVTYAGGGGGGARSLAGYAGTGGTGGGGNGILESGTPNPGTANTGGGGGGAGTGDGKQGGNGGSGIVIVRYSV